MRNLKQRVLISLMALSGIITSNSLQARDYSVNDKIELFYAITLPTSVLVIIFAAIVINLIYKLWQSKIRQKLIMEIIKQEKELNPKVIESISHFNRDRKIPTLTYPFACAIIGIVSFTLGIIMIILNLDTNDYIGFLICMVIPSVFVGGYGIGRLLSFFVLEKRRKEEQKRSYDENSIIADDIIDVTEIEKINNTENQ